MKKLLYLYAFILITYSSYGQEVFFPVDKAGVAFEAFLKDADNIDALAFVKKYGGSELPKGVWNPPESYYIIYRNLSLRYWFSVDVNRLDYNKSRLDGVVANKPSLRISREQGYLVTYTQFIPHGSMVKVDKLMMDGAISIDNLRKTNNEFIAKLAKLGKELNSNSSGNLDGLVTEEEQAMNIAISDVLLRGDTKAQELYQSLKSKYGSKSVNKNLPASMGEVWRDMVDDDYKAQEYKEAGLDPNASEQVQDYNSKGSKDGKDKTSASGMKGPFKIKTPFSKWFALTIKLVARYFGVEELGYRLLFAAYLIAPELFDFCGSFLGKIQHTITAKTFDEFLNNVATVIEYVDQFYSYAREIQSLLGEKSLKDLVARIDFKKFDLGKTLEVAQKMKLVDKSVTDKINKWVPVDMINGKILSDKKLFTKAIIDQTKKRTVGFVDQKLQRAGLPISISGLADCDNRQCVQNQFKEQSLNLATFKVPALKRNRGAIGELLNGDFKKAAKSAASTELSQQLGLNVQNIEQALSALENKDYRNFLLNVTDVVHKKYPQCPELTSDFMNLVRSNKVSIETMRNVATCVLESTGKNNAANRVRQGWDVAGGLVYAVEHHQEIGNFLNGGFQKWLEQELQKRGFTKEQIRYFVEGKAQGLIISMLKDQIHSAGFDAPGVDEAVLQGDFNKVLDLQIAHSTQPISTKEKLQRSKQAIEMRYQFLQDLKERTQNCMTDPSCLESLTLKY